MRAILFEHAEITGIRSRKDRSASLTVVTSELSDEHRSTLFGLHGVNVKILVESLDSPDDEPPVEVKGEKQAKSLSERLYGVIFAYFKQLDSPGNFEDFRKAQMEKFISHVKSKLEPF